jgi:hypothetical protein
MLRLILAIVFGFMTLWHGPAMALSAHYAPQPHHARIADAPADHRHGPAAPSDQVNVCPVLTCCIGLAPSAAAVGPLPRMGVPVRSDVISTMVADGPAPPVPPPRFPV